jgi:hypothetical protein
MVKFIAGFLTGAIAAAAMMTLWAVVSYRVM